MMNRLRKRLQIYGLVCTLLILTLWIFVPNTRSQPLKGGQVRAKRKVSNSPQEVVEKTSKEELSWLSRLFKKTDTTSDGALSVNELTWAIQKAVGKHVREAMMSNPRTFFSLDKMNHNGQVEWKEWLNRFYQDHNVKSEANMPRSLKEKLAAAKAAWSEAARSNPDALNIDEFLSFVHPESSHSALAQQLDEVIGRHDDNGDGNISLKEYLEDPFIQYTDEEIAWRKRQFTDQIDADGDGLANRREFLSFLDPKNVGQAKEEALRLIMEADADSDGFLQWKEVEQMASIFLKSKWVSPEKVFHWDL